MKQRIGAILLSGAMAFSLCACTSIPGPEPTGAQSPEVTQTADGIAPLREVEYPESISYYDNEKQWAMMEENTVEEETIDQINSFSYQTAAELLRGEESGNYSPISLYLALALCTTGAQQETQQEMLQALGASDIETLAEQCGKLYRTLYTDNEIGELKIHNSIWLNEAENVDCKKDFLRTAALNFCTGVYQLDFSDESAGETIGKWIADHANGTLTPELQINPDDLLHLINTVYFYDQWTDRFSVEETVADTFHGTAGDETIDFMNRVDASQGFVKGEGFTRASLGMKNGNTMTFVLPDEGRSPAEFLQSPEALEAAFTAGEMESGEVTWKIPKFSIEAKYSCENMLQDLGIQSAFSQTANFSGMTNSLAYLDSVLQETYIGVNEKGVEASAFTDIAVAGAAMPTGEAKMILDRPFLYAIENGSGVILFIGVYQGGAGETAQP